MHRRHQDERGSSSCQLKMVPSLLVQICIVSQSSVILFPQHIRACDAFGSLVQLGRADFDPPIDGKLEHLRRGRTGGRESDIAL